MRIQPIQNYRNNSISRNNKPTFQSWEREVFTQSKDGFVKELKHRNDTSFFRDGKFWSDLVYYMMYKYQNTEKVNVYNYACSDGSEPYSLLMTLISIWGLENVEKYLPIKAKDYDPVAIEKAKSGFYRIRNYESNAILGLTYNQADTFLNRYIIEDKIVVEPKNILTRNVEFEVANIFEDYKNINPENSVVLARNFWPYLKMDSIDLVQKLASQMKKNSLLVLGHFDRSGCKINDLDLTKLLEENGFKPSQINNLIFEK